MAGGTKQAAIFADLDSKADTIWEMVAEGRGQRPIAEALGTSRASVQRWLQKNEEQWIAVRKSVSHVLAEECMEISDSATPGDASVSKLRVDTRKWLARALNPQMYGEGPKVAIQINAHESFAQGLRDALGWDANGSPTTNKG